MVAVLRATRQQVTAVRNTILVAILEGLALIEHFVGIAVVSFKFTTVGHAILVAINGRLTSIRNPVHVAVGESLTVIGNVVSIAVHFASVGKTIIIAIGITFVRSIVVVTILRGAVLKIAPVGNTIAVAVWTKLAFIGDAVVIAIVRSPVVDFTRVRDPVAVAVWLHGTWVRLTRGIGQPLTTEDRARVGIKVFTAQQPVVGARQTASAFHLALHISSPAVQIHTGEFTAEFLAGLGSGVHAFTRLQAASSPTQPMGLGENAWEKAQKTSKYHNSRRRHIHLQDPDGPSSFPPEMSESRTDALVHQLGPESIRAVPP